MVKAAYAYSKDHEIESMLPGKSGLGFGHITSTGTVMGDLAAGQRKKKLVGEMNTR